MSVEPIARTLAVTLAILGALDPAWPISMSAPRPIDLRGHSADAVATVRGRLEQTLKDEVTFSSSQSPAARVIVGDDPDAQAGEIPTSFVSVHPLVPRNTRIVALTDPLPGIVGWRNAATVTVEGRGVAGTVSIVTIEQNGAELGRHEHKWTRAEERAEVTIPFVPPAEGVFRLTVRVLPVAGEPTADDNVADVRSAASTRRLKVLVHEPRPSWTAAFVRRVLEENPGFDVSASAVASKGLGVKAGTPPEHLQVQAIDEFDAVVVGAPEELTSRDVDALEAFARRRGGAIVLVPDRRPSGAFLRLLQSREFDEVLVEKPIGAQSVDGALRASELAIPRFEVAPVDVVASIDRGGVARPLVFTTPLGAGRVVFSGAMDAWRFRATDESGETFARFWSTTVAGAALASPPKLTLLASPGVVRPGELVDVMLRIRRSELRDAGADPDIPSVQARLIPRRSDSQPDGRQEEIIRLWPSTEPGVFIGRARIGDPGDYVIDATAGPLTAHAVIISAGDGHRPDDGDARREAIARATGGVVVTPDDVSPLVGAIRALPASRVTHDRRPTRSIWFVSTFAALLCVEWTMRRRTGRR
jgi:hypothetical protein